MSEIEDTDKSVCTLKRFVNDDGTYLELRDQRGVKCLYRCDEKEAMVEVRINTETGEILSAYVSDVSDMIDE